AITSSVNAFKGKPLPITLAIANVGSAVGTALGVPKGTVTAKSLGAKVAAQVRKTAPSVAPSSASASVPSTVPASVATPAVAKAAVPPAATPIPSQSLAAQTQMAELANQLTSAQNAGSTVGQQNALNAEIKLERSWLTADQKTLAQINKAIADRHLSRAKHVQLLTDKLAVLQEIGTVQGKIGSDTSTLAGLGGNSGSFNLAPGGAAIKLPTVYDVRSRLPRIPASAHRPLAHGIAAGSGGAPVAAPQITVAPVFHIKAQTQHDAHAIKDIVTKAVGAMADDLDRSVSSHLRARLRSAGMRGT
ncbi:MAG TPA: hypothetical protein VN803_03630, partial [Gemmatimonadales bacterium]|nr:hypothetical protein [Gemmatimonadales bacterium]